MTMKNINPTETKAWQQLTTHYNDIKNLHLKSLSNGDGDRKNKFTINFNDLEFDVRNLGAKKAIETALEFKPECGSLNHHGRFFNIGG